MNGGDTTTVKTNYCGPLNRYPTLNMQVQKHNFVKNFST